MVDPALVVGADVPVADVIAKNDEDIRLLLLRVEVEHRNNYPETAERADLQSFHVYSSSPFQKT